MASASKPTCETRSAEVCPCCGGGHGFRWGAKWSACLERSFDLFRCAHCGFRWVEPFAGYGIYDEAYYRGEGPDPFVDYEREYADYASTDRVLEFDDLRRLVSGNASLEPGGDRLRWLDFGCGAGGLLKYLRDRPTLELRGRTVPLELAGHDIGAYAKRLREADGFAILDEAGLRAARGSFDVVTCIEVAEHVRETRALFARLAELLAPGGLLVLTTGNLSSFAARKAGAGYRYIMPEVHVSLFDPGCLVRLYRENGLEPVRLRYDGVVRYKVVKSLAFSRWRSAARLLLRFSPLVRAIDAAYGVSAMPCARKPPADRQVRGADNPAGCLPGGAG